MLRQKPPMNLNLAKPAGNQTVDCETTAEADHCGIFTKLIYCFENTINLKQFTLTRLHTHFH